MTDTQDLALKAMPVLVIGVGNAFRCDDGIGLAVARGLQQHQVPGMTVATASGEGASLMAQWANWDTVFLVDALHTGALPGTVQRFDLTQQRVPASYLPVSSHAFGVAEAIEMARVLRQLPQRLVLVGIEGQNFSIGTRMSLTVCNAIPLAVSQLLAELSTMRKSWTSAL